jgi:hypothetical protein
VMSRDIGDRCARPPRSPPENRYSPRSARNLHTPLATPTHRVRILWTRDAADDSGRRGRGSDRISDR